MGPRCLRPEARFQACLGGTPSFRAECLRLEGAPCMTIGSRREGHPPSRRRGLPCPTGFHHRVFCPELESQHSRNTCFIRNEKITSIVAHFYQRWPVLASGHSSFAFITIALSRVQMIPRKQLPLGPFINFASAHVDIFSEIFGFLFRKKTLLIVAPIAAVIVIVMVLLVVSQGSGWEPFMYPLF